MFFKKVEFRGNQMYPQVHNLLRASASMPRQKAASFIQPSGRVIKREIERYQKLLFSSLCESEREREEKKGSPTLFPCFLFAFEVFSLHLLQFFLCWSLKMGDKDDVLEAVVKEAVDLVPLICFLMGFSSMFVLYFFLIVLFETLFFVVGDFGFGFWVYWASWICRRTCLLKRFFRLWGVILMVWQQRRLVRGWPFLAITSLKKKRFFCSLRSFI